MTKIASIKCLPLPKCNFRYIIFNRYGYPIEWAEQIIVWL